MLPTVFMRRRLSAAPYKIDFLNYKLFFRTRDDDPRFCFSVTAARLFAHSMKIRTVWKLCRQKAGGGGGGKIFAI